MATISLSHAAASRGNHASKTALSTRFINWCSGQQENRLLWLGVALGIHGCLVTPVALMTVMLTGANPILIFLTAASMGTPLVVNLAAMPTRISIPVFMGSVLLSIAVMIAAISGM